MLAIPGFESFDTCDGVTRRDLLRIGGSSVFGLSLAQLFASQARASERPWSATTSASAGSAAARACRQRCSPPSTAW